MRVLAISVYSLLESGFCEPHAVSMSEKRNRNRRFISFAIPPK